MRPVLLVFEGSDGERRKIVLSMSDNMLAYYMGAESRAARAALGLVVIDTRQSVTKERT